MPKFRKGDTVVDAVQWLKHGDHPEVHRIPRDPTAEGGFIKTDDGYVVICPGDWIITQDGKHSRCHPTVFSARYSPA